MKRYVLVLFTICAAVLCVAGQKRDTGRKSANSLSQKKPCFSKKFREAAERTARVYHEPDTAYDPVLGYNPAMGMRAGAPAVDENGLGKPFQCMANVKENPGTGTLPKFYCSASEYVDDKGDLIRFKIKPHFKGQERDKRNGEVTGEFLSSRFSQALGFYADDAWVADVTCPDCERSLTKKFQGAKFDPFQPAAGISLSLGKGIDVDCDDKDSAPLAETLKKLRENGGNRSEIDAFTLWLAFIDHGDTKTDNHSLACLKPVSSRNGTLTCAPGQTVFFVSDMGSTFGFSSASEQKARLELWRKKEPLKIEDNKCYTTAKDVGDKLISEGGRKLLAGGLQRLLDGETKDGLITKVFRASRNAERDEPPEVWTAEFISKANMIISARCTD
ncbi:MAG: hypothetical protein ABIV21_05825 [Pyrinomonadaceae bacterium]